MGRRLLQAVLITLGLQLLLALVHMRQNPLEDRFIEVKAVSVHSLPFTEM